MSFVFDRNRRLRSAADFKQVFDHTDIKVSSRYCLILVRITPNPASRLGLVIAKKNIRYASDRNRVKRHIRETFRHQQSELNHLDIVVLARKGLDKLESKDMNVLLNKQWDKVSKRLSEWSVSRAAAS